MLQIAQLSLAAALVLGCGDNLNPTAEPDAGAGGIPEIYEFESRFSPGESSVAYNGQLFRQLLIDGYKAELGSWTGKIDNEGAIRSASEWLEELNFFFRFDSATSLGVELAVGLEEDTVQSTWRDISSGASLIEKLAGEDDVTDHKDWDGDGEPAGATGSLVGWSEGPARTPLELVDYWMGLLAEQAAGRPLSIPVDPFGNDIEEVHITSKGQDLRQISQKFLSGAVIFSQATDDYLDSGTAGKGLDSTNLQNDDKPYSTLEHTWDEGFGYFGAARSYGVMSPDERAMSTVDVDGDGAIDLKTEYNTGMSKNASKRDLASHPGAETDFAGQVIGALIAGRHIVWTAAGSELTTSELADLDAERNIVVDQWASVFAASVIHYINAVIAEMGKINGTVGGYSFTEHAKLWGELKGFALAFQFNPRTKLSDVDFERLHALLGDAPVVTSVEAELDDYRDNLLAARALIGDAHGFATANVEAW